MEDDDDRPRPAVGRTEFGELREEHQALDRKHEEMLSRLSAQDRKLLELGDLSVRNGKNIEQQSVDLLANTRAIARTEDKVDQSIAKSEKLLEAFDAISGTLKTLEWLGKKVAPLGIGLGFLVAFWDRLFPK